MADVTIYDGDVTVIFEDVNLHDALKKHFGASFPKGAHLFEGQCAVNCDITPKTKEDIDAIDPDNGEYFIISGFSDPLTVITVVAAVVSIASTVISIFLQPDIPTLENTQAGSSNNLLSDRRNRLRPNGRIFDIFGRVRTTPDLISVPIRTFINNREVETALMCLGRGSYQVSEIRDGTTLISDINDASCEVYRPFTSPNSGEPDVLIGTRITGGVTDNRRLRAVNGQTLLAPNAVDQGAALQNESARFLSTFIDFQLDVSGGVVAGSPITISAPQVFISSSDFGRFGGFTSTDLSGTYDVLSVSVEVRITPIDAAGADIGPTETFSTVITGSSEERSSIGRTLTCNPTFTGFARIEAERITLADLEFEGTVSDQIVWRDLFFTAPVDVPHFGDVTLVQSRTVATEQAAGITDRELNMVAIREVPTRIGNTNTFTAPMPTESSDDIIVAMCIDPFIGRMDISDLDIDDIYGAVESLREYYGSDEATKFCIALDDDNLSIQETLNIVGSALGLQMYRMGRVLRAFPVVATEEAALVFNHRNKMPSSDIIRDRFGAQSDVDGVRLLYVDDRDFVTRQINIPENETAQSPRTVSGVGVGNTLQAYHKVWRARNTDLYQVGSHEFQAMPEAQLLIRGQNIFTADNTRCERFDGEIRAINGLTLTLSQDLDFDPQIEYAITVQHRNMTTEIVPIASHEGNQVTLTRPLSLPLFIEDGGVFNPPYVITGESNSFVRTLRVLRTTPDTTGMTRVEASVYTPLIHLNDAITLWFRDGLEDFGPFIASPNAMGAQEVNDATRGAVISVDNGGSLSPNLQQTDNYSFAAWVYVAAGHTGVTVKETGNGLIDIRADGSVSLSQQGDSIISAIGTVQPNAWTHIAATYSGGVFNTLKLFVNGSLVEARMNVNAETSPIQIGGASAFLIDDVRLYRRTMGDSEINAMYLATRL